MNVGSSTFGEVVDAGVGLAVGVLDEPGDRLDALPRHARRRVRVLRGLQIARPHRVGQHLDDPDELVGLADGVPLVVVCRLLQAPGLGAAAADVEVSAELDALLSSVLPASLLEQPARTRAAVTSDTGQVRCSFIEPPRSRRENITSFYPRKGRHT